MEGQVPYAPSRRNMMELRHLLLVALALGACGGPEGTISSERPHPSPERSQSERGSLESTAKRRVPIRKRKRVRVEKRVKIDPLREATQHALRTKLEREEHERRIARYSKRLMELDQLRPRR